MRAPASLLGLCALLAASAARAEVDGSKPLVCDLVEAAQCDGLAACSDVTLEQIDLPGPIHVDFAGSRLHSTDEQRTSPIASVAKEDAVLLLQGSENGRAWTMVIDRATGHLSATLADAEGAIVIAGACTAK